MTRKEEDRKKIKELEEKVKKLEEEVKAEEEGEEETGIAEEIIGGFFPGLGKMVKGLKKSEVFRERLEEVDREVEERMKGKRGRYSMEKRPHVDFDLSVRTLTGKEHEPSFRRQRDRIRAEKIKEKEHLIDIADEKDYIVVTIEMPGVEEKDIKTEIRGDDKLIISTKGRDKSKYYKEVDLPSPVREETKRTYKHGVLEVKLEKE